MNTLQQLYPTATKEQIERNKTALIKNAIENGYTDEDEPEAESMAARYADDDETTHLEEFDKAGDR